MNNKFFLTESFIDKYKHKQVSFGFNGFGELVYLRTYSRIKPNGENERWWETVKRVVEGCYNIQKRWIETHNLGWNNHKAQLSAQEMYDKIFNMKFLPPGRGLWAMGSPLIEERQMYAALNNCAFVSTENLNEDYSKPFCFLMDMSMLGVGVGFDTKGAGKVLIKGINKKFGKHVFQIPDTREGWVESVKLLLESYFFNLPYVDFDYSLIRPSGVLIKGFGGISSGCEPLKECHKMLRIVLERNSGNPITTTTIVDIMNLLGKCVVSGNVRRSAEIVFGDYRSEEYLKLKDYKWDSVKGKYVGSNAERAEYGWTSNNSIFADLGMDYTIVGKQTAENGEPGYAWLENMRGYSRMNNGMDFKDKRVAGGNPCLEQSLESYELCCLVEAFPAKHDSFEEFKRTLKYAYLYAKTVTLCQTHWPETNRVLLRNRRIGCSMSGIVQAIDKFGIHEFKKWCEQGYEVIENYDEIYSEWFAVPKSIKKTSVKPSGTISLLAGSTPGVHFPESRFYIRRIRLAKDSELLEPLKQAGFNIEPDVTNKETTVVVEWPISLNSTKIRTINETNIWEQLMLAAFMQRYWADNQVSCTVTFKEHEKNQIPIALNYFQYLLKGVSFLPKLTESPYKQMPYEEISEEEYNKIMKKITFPIKFGRIKGEIVDTEKYCDGDRCKLFN